MVMLKFIQRLNLLTKTEHFYLFKRFIKENQWTKQKMNKELPPHRIDPIIKKLDSPEFKSIFTPELVTLSEIFKKYNFEIRIAGGAVRDILMGMVPKDLDFATTATPTEMKDMFNKEEIRMINTNGEKHGTITSRINDKENFEVTTLRIDVVTNGRHADVLFTTNWLLDANRRDLTVNSMFLDLDGNIYDYFYGYDDLIKRRVAFVGDPAERICEDFLRILRYFRFYGRISEVPDNHDESTIKAIKENVVGLEIISGERIWSEWAKIMDGNFHEELTLKIVECGCGKYMGLPENVNLNHFQEVCSTARKNNVKLQPITKVVALLNHEQDVMDLFLRLKFSAFERNLALFITLHRDDKLREKPLKPYQLLVLKTIGKQSDMKEFVCELFKYRGQLELLEEFNKWDSHFPINGKMIQPFVEPSRIKVIGNVLFKLKDIWVENDCKMSTEKLKSYIPDLVEEATTEFQEKLRNINEAKIKAKQRKKN